MQVLNRWLGWSLVATTATMLAGCNAGGGASVTTSDSNPSASAEGASPEAAAPDAATTEIATLAGGCFWGMEELLRAIPGVRATEVGYTGGDVDHATYQDVKKGTSGHAESVRITFDPSQVAYADLLRWFFRMHDPTTVNQQGNDIGTQYRSAVFYHSEAQRLAAEAAKVEAAASGRWDKPIVTAVVPAGPFWSAEDYHQDYLQKNPDGYTCHWIRD